MMSKKDYIAVSNILKEYRQEMVAEKYSELVVDFGKYMAKDNEKFDYAIFAQACNIPK